MEQRNILIQLFLLNYDDDEYYSQGYGQIKEVFGALAKDVILESCILDHHFKSPNNNNDIGYNLYVFDIRYHKFLENAQPTEVDLDFQKIFLLVYMVTL